MDHPINIEPTSNYFMVRIVNLRNFDIVCKKRNPKVKLANVLELPTKKMEDLNPSNILKCQAMVRLTCTTVGPWNLRETLRF